ncbi:MAG: hypothetical protein LBR92_02425 [Puniceicoccales bacterium]|jgi:hypothetical protein|nr:hypothetical protein [Puniceicoccales bacterium]
MDKINKNHPIVWLLLMGSSLSVSASETFLFHVDNIQYAALRFEEWQQKPEIAQMLRSMNPQEREQERTRYMQRIIAWRRNLQDRYSQLEAEHSQCLQNQSEKENA